MAIDPDEEPSVFYAPVQRPKEWWIESCRWEADAIEVHLAARSERPRIGQRKTVRLLRRLADFLEQH